MTPTPAPVHTNRLARETSPYLLQHAHNPVDWYPWGEEAFAEARRRGVPILLSIGYSTCYWCHVMERESFEDEATAEILNRRVVAIKVDREERPDVDEIYMTGCQIFTQLTEGRASGGWPLTVFIEPESLRPYFVGTYYPPREKFGRPAFGDLVTAMADAYATRHDEVLAQAERLAELIEQEVTGSASIRPLGEATVRACRDSLMHGADGREGGFGGAPKFPQPVFLELLLEIGWSNATVKTALTHTADRMAVGGLFDQVGGGFHRYCVDGTWTVPHFEKMLYDNGQLASFYAALVERTSDPFHAETLRRTLDYVLREMTTESGAFASAQDAEVNAREGQSFLWTPKEVRAALEAAGRADLWPMAESIYGLGGSHNFVDPHHPGAAPSFVLRLASRPEVLAKGLDLPLDEFNTRRAALNEILKGVRDQRPQPMRDDKVIVSWNGMMIAGLADGGRALREPRFVAAAVRAAEFILAHMRAPDGGLFRVHRGGQSRIPAFLEDYAALARGLVALARADDARRERWLTEAGGLLDAALARFSDPRGGCFDTLEGQGDLFVRTRSISDGAMPSGNSMLIAAMLDLAEAIKESRPGAGASASAASERWIDEAVAALAGLSGAIDQNGIGSSLAVASIARVIESHPEQLDQALSRALAQAQPASGAGATAHGSTARNTASSPPDAAIALSVEPRELTLGTGSTDVTLTVIIPAGVHINAHDPGEPGLIGLDISLSEDEAFSLEVDYPAGDAGEGASRVHHGTLRVPIRLVRRNSGTQRALADPSSFTLLVTLQPCTNEFCLRPATHRVTVVVQSK